MIEQRTSPAPVGGERLFIEGERPAPPPTLHQLLPMDPSANFVYLHHPACWDVEADAEGKMHIVPRLRVLRFEPGISGVESERGHTDGNPTRALAELGQRGWVVIPASLRVIAHGAEVEGYVRRYAGHRGPVHLDVWSRPYKIGTRAVIDFDKAGWLAFRLQLVKDELIRPIDPSVRRALQLDLERAKRKRLNNKLPTAQASAAPYEAKLDAFNPAPAATPSTGKAKGRPSKDDPPKETP